MRPMYVCIYIYIHFISLRIFETEREHKETEGEAINE